MCMIILYVQSVCVRVCSVHASVGNMGSYMIFTLALALALASGFCLFLRSMNCCHYLQFSKIAFCSPFWAVCSHYCFALRFVFVCTTTSARTLCLAAVKNLDLLAKLVLFEFKCIYAVYLLKFPDSDWNTKRLHPNEMQCNHFEI